jgi:hypothetical protein
MAYQSRIFAFVLSLASIAYCSFAAGDVPNDNQRLQYPTTRVRQGEENKPKPWRDAISVHALTAPLTAGWVGLVQLYDEPTKFGGVANGGLQVDYQYRFGTARLGLGLHWRMLYEQGAEPLFDKQLHDIGVPFIVSVMGSHPTGFEFGGTFGLGLGIVGVESINWNRGPGPNLYTPKQWHWGTFVSAEALFAAAVPLGHGIDLSIRAGIEFAVGAIFRISTPMELGIRKRF